MKVLTADQMRQVDRLTTERYAIPSLLLMENAAARTVEATERRFGPLTGRRALIVCGKGNNGGDGAGVARQLWMRDCKVDLIILGRIEDARGDARLNFDIVRSIASTQNSGLRVIKITESDQLRQEFCSALRDIYFDAIFGTGLTRPAEGIFQEAIRLINEAGNHRPVVAIDIPSGLSSDSHELIGSAARAHITVTLTAPKIANLLPPASELGGEIVVAHIGSPEELIIESGSQINLVEREMVAQWLEESRRSPHANKGDAGKALIIAGSRGKSGAASLAGEGALRAGAGLVTIATSESALSIVASQAMPECMTEPLFETDLGSVSSKSAGRALELAEQRDVVAIGPGLGSAEAETRSFVREVTLRRARPVVMDADALNALAPWDEEIRGEEGRPLILTPHPGEMARLTGKTIAEVLSNRISIAREFAVTSQVILVLKGSRSLIAAPSGQVYINPTGNAGMATGGTGDVLTGIIAGLIAQKLDDPLAATIAAVYLHGLAGDIATSSIGVRAMTASDISHCLGEAFIEVGGEQERASR